MEESFDGSCKLEDQQKQSRREKGKKRTQIIVSGYKGQKEEYINAINKQFQTGVDQFQNNSQINMLQNSSLIQQNDQTQFHDFIQESDSDVLQLRMNKSVSNDKLNDLYVSPEQLEQYYLNYKKNSQVSRSQKGYSKQRTMSTSNSKKTMNYPYQGQDIINDMFFNYQKIYEGRKLLQNEDSTNLPLVMKLKEVAIKLANSIQTRKQKQLTEQSYTLIDDKSFYLDRNELKSESSSISLLRMTKNTIQNYINIALSKLFLLFNECVSHIPIISPSNNYKLMWDLLQVMVIVLCLYFVPIVFVFKMQFTEILPSIVCWLCPLLLILDIPINMNTGFYDKGVLIKSRNLIIQSYLKQHYINDILSIVPLVIHFLLYELNYKKSNQAIDEDYQLSEFFLLFIFFKSYHLSDIIRRIEERYHFTPRTMNIISLIKLLVTVLFVAHLFSQLWLFTAFIESTKTQYQSWIQFYNLQNSNWQQQYIRAYYFAMVTMITVGYGDTLPTNDPEMILCIFTMLIACGIFAYSVNSIGMILMDFSSREKEMKDNLFTINNYMDQKNVNQDLQYKIRQYLDYYWKEMKDSNIEKEEKIISQLSELLKDELLLEANKFILKESLIFSNNFTDYIIMRTVKLIHEYRCAPKETICFEDQQDDCSIFFIQKGEVDIYIDSLTQQENQHFQQSSSSKNGQNSNRILKSLKKGDHFGGISFFTGTPRSYSICSKEFSTLLVIKRQDFIDLLTKESPEDYEMFCAIKDNILLYKNYQQLSMECFSCKNDGHLMGDCPLIHYTVNKEFIIRKHQFSPPQCCNRQQKRKDNQFRSLLKLKYVQDRIAKFCDDDEYENVLDEYEKQYGILSLSSDSEGSCSEDDSQKMDRSVSTEKSCRVSISSISKRNSRQQKYEQDTDNAQSQDNSQMNLQQSDGNFFSQKNILNINQIQSGIYRSGNVIQGGSTGKISQKNISSSENVLEDSDYTKVIKVAENLLYGSEAGFNTQTQFAKSYRTWEDRQFTYQISGSQVSKQKSKLTNNLQYSVKSQDTSIQQFMTGVNCVTDELLKDNVQNQSFRNKSVNKNGSKMSKRSDYEQMNNNEMRYIDDSGNDRILFQYQKILEKLNRNILDIQLNQNLTEEQKDQSISLIHNVIEKLRGNYEPERLSPQLFRVSDNQSSQNINKHSFIYNAQKIDILYKQLFNDRDNEQQYNNADIQNNKEKKSSPQNNKDHKKRGSHKKEANQKNDEEIKEKEEEFDLKKIYFQYFPHNNYDKVIQIANLCLKDRKKKVNKLIVNKKMNKVERKQGRHNTRMNTYHSKFNKLLNTFQNQTEGEETEINDNVSVKSKAQTNYKRKLSLFGQQQQQEKNSKKSDCSSSSNNSPKNLEKSLNATSILQQKQCVSDLSFQNDVNCQNNLQNSNNQINNGEKQNCRQSAKNNQRQQEVSNTIITNSDIDVGFSQQNMIKQNESKEGTTHKKEGTSHRKEESKSLKNLNHDGNDIKSKPVNLLGFQRPVGKKKLSEIPENECQSGYISSNNVGSQQLINVSRNQNQQSIYKDMSETSSDQQNLFNSLVNKQESLKLILGGKRASNNLNLEDQNLMLDKFLASDNNANIDTANKKQANAQNKIPQNSHFSAKDLNQFEKSNRSLSDNQDRKSQCDVNDTQWIINYGKDDGINAICNMNIGLTNVKRYHNQEE